MARRYEFFFRVAKQYFTNEGSECVKYCFCHEKIKFISSSRRVMFFLLYRQKGIDKKGKITKITSSINSRVRLWKINHSGPGCSFYEFCEWCIFQYNTRVYIINMYNYGRIILSLFFKIKRKIGVLLTHEFRLYTSLCGNLEFQTAKNHILLRVLCLKRMFSNFFKF